MHIAWFETWAEAEHGRFVLWLPVAMCAGVVWYFAQTAEPPPWLGAAVAIAGLGPLLAWRHRRLAWAICAPVCAIGMGVAAAQWATGRQPAVVEIPTHATIVQGAVLAVETLPSGRRVLIGHPSLDGQPPLPRALRLRLRPADATEIATGDTIRLRAMLSRPPSPAYPGGWDLQRDAYFTEIGGYGYGLNPSQVIAHTQADRPGSVQRLREIVAGRIAAVLGGADGAIAATLLTGSASAIPAADRAAFRDSGLSHLLAIAGLHIGIVMGLLFGAVRGGLALSERAALHWPLKSIAAVAALLGGAAYLFMTGAHVPIIRSFAMASLVTLGILAGRRALSLRGLGLAMAAVVLIAPHEVVGVSFQMSFSAVLALIVGYELLRPWLTRLHGDGRWRRLASHIVSLALTSALAGTFSAPFGAYHFGHIQLYFVLANMVAVPITAMLIMPAGLVALALMPLHLELLALQPMGWGIDAVLAVAHSVAAWPAATLPVPSLPPWGLIVFSLGLAWLGLWRTRFRLVGLVVMAVGLASPAFETPPDILVSADARLIALRVEGTMLVQRSAGGAAFTEEAWQQYWATPPAVPLACPTPNCLLRARGGSVAALLVRAAPEPADCSQTLLISAEPIRLRCSEPVAWIDRFTVWRQGAQAVWLRPDGVRVLSDHAVRGARPWVIGLPLAGKIPPNTTAALAE